MEVEQPIRKLDFESFVTDTPSKRHRAPQNNASKPTNIEVYLRIRPTDPSQTYSSQYAITNQNQSIRLTAPNKADTRSYSFNHVFDPATTNVQVFEQIGRKTINRFLDGYTNLLFAYGITGSGKTHTITGSGNNMDGLLPSILRNLFNHKLIRNSNKYTLFVTYLENYTKELYDLLRTEEQNNKENMNIRNNHAYNTNKRTNNTNKVNLRVLNDGVDILDATTIQIESAQEALQLIASGNARRSKSCTKFNRNSSRSHALFIVDLFEADQAKSRLCLVDLAGSESVKRNGFSMNDIGFNEACEINSSLSVLGRCIEAIESKNKAPWREATLTRLLWSYLHGEGFVTMIVNAHICNAFYNETMRALEFASKTQNIEMNPIVNSVRPSTRHKTRICKTPKRAESKSISCTPSRNISREGSTDINFIHSCNIDQLRKIASEAYKTALRSQKMMKQLRSNKIEMFDKILKHELKAKMKGIQEENAMDIDQDEDLVDKCNKEWDSKYNAAQNALKSKTQEYDALCKQMAEKVMNFEEKTVKFKSEMNALNEKHENESMKQNMKIQQIESKYNQEINMKMIQMQEIESKYDQEVNNVKSSLHLDIKDLEQDLMNKVTKIKQLENAMNELQITKINLESNQNAMRDTIEELQKQQTEMQQKESKLEGFERNKELEYKQKEIQWKKSVNEIRSKQKQVLLENHRLEATAARYKSIIDESEQKLAKYAHVNREQKSKTQQQHIEITELREKHKKLINMMTELKVEFKGKMDEFEKIEHKLQKQLDQRKRTNDDAEKEILLLHQSLTHTKNELKEHKNYKAEFEQLTQEFIQRGEELKNVKHVNIATQKQLEQQKLVYEKKITALSKDISDTKQLSDRDIAAKSQMIAQLNDEMKALEADYQQKMQHLQNKCDKKCLSQENIIAEKLKTIDTIMQQHDALMQKLNENENWSEKYQKLFATFTKHSEQNKELKAKYTKQTEQFAKLKEELHELKHCKNDLMSNLKAVQDEMEKNAKEIQNKMVSNQTEKMRNKCAELQKLQNEYNQHKQSSDEMIQNKDKQIDELHSKYVESDAIYQQLQAEYDILENKYSDVTNNRDKIENEWIETNENVQTTLQQKTKEIEIIHSELNDAHEALEMKENEFHELNDEMTKQKEFHRIALKEADEEYLREQQESKELYELNTKLEDKNKHILERLQLMTQETQQLKQEIASIKESEKKLTKRHNHALLESEKKLITQHKHEINQLQQKLEKTIENYEQKLQMQLKEETVSYARQIKSLQEQLKQLQLTQTLSRRDSNVSNVTNVTNTHVSERRGLNRKRSREQMESSPSDHNNLVSNPNKKRKITTDGASMLIHTQIAMETDTNTDDNNNNNNNNADTNTILDELADNQLQADSCNDGVRTVTMSLQPHNLLNEYNKAAAAQIKIDHDEETESETQEDTTKPDEDIKFAMVISDDEGEEEEDDEDDDDDVEIIQSDDSHMELKTPEEDIINSELIESEIQLQTTPIKPKPKKKLVTPSLSHLSEGDTPLPKASTNKMRKAISRHNKPKIKYTKSTPTRNKNGKPKKYLAMRTPCTKQRRRYTTQPFDVNEATPTTKTALGKLRVVDLRQKLKKHNLKTKGNKDKLIQTLFNHKLKNATKEDEEHEEDEEALLDTDWIGKCIKTTNGKKYYKGIRVNGVQYNLGSQVFVLNDTDNDWMAQVVELYEDEDGGCFMNNVWFWKHGEIERAIKSKPYNAWKPAEDEVFLSNGHELDNNHVSLINVDQQFKVFENKKDMMKYRRNNEVNEKMQTFFCEYIFNLKGHRLIRKESLEDIEEGNENEIDSENNTNSKPNSRRRKRKTTSSKCVSPKNKRQRNNRRRRRQKSTK